VTGGPYKKDKCPFPHYGYLVVDWYGQNGIPLEYVYRMRSRLIGPHAISGLVVKERRAEKMKKNPGKLLCKTEGEHIAVKGRELDTWFANAMVSQFFVENEVREAVLRSEHHSLRELHAVAILTSRYPLLCKIGSLSAMSYTSAPACRYQCRSP
jgi:hypothetical protein